MTAEELYGLNYPVKSLAIANPFIEKVLFKSSYTLGQQMHPFCMYANEIQKKYSVVDMATFKGLLNPNISLLDEITDYRKEVFKNNCIYVDNEDDLKKKYLFYDYLLTTSICYVEVPKFVTRRDGTGSPGYDKFFATRNPVLMGTWMGVEPSAMQIKYLSQIQLNQALFNDNEIRLVKCMHKQKGNTISVPKKAISIEKMTCIPLFMLNALVDGVKPYLQDRIVEFTFIKDNGTVRIVPTTLNENILMDYYHDTSHVASLLGGTDIDKVQQGALTMSSTMGRGHFKIPELGLSKYDETGTRSIDVARILSIREVPEVSRFFIDVDVDAVVDTFKGLIEQKISSHKEDLPLIYKDLTGKEGTDTMTVTDYISALFSEVDSRNSMTTTTFRQELHMYMIKHPQYFPNYTGMRVLNTEPIKPTSSVTSNVGNMNIGFGDDIESFG